MAENGDLESCVAASEPRTDAGRCKSIDWYGEGHSRTVEVDGVRITIRFVGRKGRRGRIAIEAPAGAVFIALDSSGAIRSHDK